MIGRQPQAIYPPQDEVTSTQLRRPSSILRRMRSRALRPRLLPFAVAYRIPHHLRKQITKVANCETLVL